MMIKLPARADTAAAIDLCPTLLEHMSDDVTFDCADLSLFSGAMAQIWLACSQTLESKQQKFSLVNVSPTLRDDLDALGFTDYLKKWEHHG